VVEGIMPFINDSRREEIARYGLEGLEEVRPGDRCYVHYKVLVDVWRADPCWTTAHTLFKGLSTDTSLDDDDYAARALAWQVFFHLHVMPYEEQKRKENGDI
jgi:hypothetical protein